MASTSSVHVEGAWCPPGHEMSDCEVVFLGDSLFRYLSQHIPLKVSDLKPAVYFRSGAKVEDLRGGSAWDMISQKTRMCVVHVGTNDLKNPSVSVFDVLAHLKLVLADLHKQNPELEIFISSVLPRGLNLRDEHTSFSIMTQRLEQLNFRISKFNQLLMELTQTLSHLHFVNNDAKFWLAGQGVQTHLLAKDGLHLSPRGVSTLAKTLVSEIEAFQLPARVPQSLSPEPESHVSSLGCPSHGSEVDEYPPLPKPACMGSDDSRSPYVITDPSLIVSKADLVKVCPWAAMIERLCDRERKVAHCWFFITHILWSKATVT